MAAASAHTRDRGVAKAEPVAPSAANSEHRVGIVPADTSFPVELATALSSNSSRPGEVVRARVLVPLVTTEGRTVVTPGADVLFHVTTTRPLPHPAILLNVDSIETNWGALPVRAGFTAAQPDPSIVGVAPDNRSHNGGVEAVAGIPLFGSTDVSPDVRRPIDLPVGTQLQLVLTAPLVVNTPALPPGLGGGPPQRNPDSSRQGVRR